MKHEFFLQKNILPKEFEYPYSYKKYIQDEPAELEPWHFYHDGLEFAFNGLKKRYPSRSVIPFARRSDNDDIACFEVETGGNNHPVIIIHDFASPGWECRGKCIDFLEWVRLAEAESKEWKELTEK